MRFGKINLKEGGKLSQRGEDELLKGKERNEKIVVHRPVRSNEDRPCVNFTKGEYDMKPLCLNAHEDPHNVMYKEFKGDPRFWLTHQADWYELVIMDKKHVTTEMRWVDWNFLRGVTSPVKEVVDAIFARCVEMDLVDIMRVTGLRIRNDMGHYPNKSPRGKIEQLLRIGARQIRIGAGCYGKPFEGIFIRHYAGVDIGDTSWCHSLPGGNINISSRPYARRRFT
ncbi:putative copia-type pol polyprotein [Panicum miliaceum]|uniref:Copia-type pol polyprotein n=1 Tax=Panicum miliaceum TaxID=4540 RepID=A0A3L6RG78_PANMI|nr:putative copia-type pol polyprotein [Panicum miliaceum]